MRQLLMITMMMALAFALPAGADDTYDPAVTDKDSIGASAKIEKTETATDTDVDFDADVDTTGDTDRDLDMDDDDKLPRTASPLPLLALLGGSSLAGALGLRRIRNRR